MPAVSVGLYEADPSFEIALALPVVNPEIALAPTQRYDPLLGLPPQLAVRVPNDDPVNWSQKEFMVIVLVPDTEGRKYPSQV